MTFNCEDFRKRFRVAALARGIDPATGSTSVQAAAVAVELGIVIAGGAVRAATPIGDVLEDVRERVHRPTEEAAIAAVMRGQPRQGDKLPITLDTLRELYPEVRREMAKPRRAVTPVVVTPGVIDRDLMVRRPLLPLPVPAASVQAVAMMI